jgi:hypothetical protein
LRTTRAHCGRHFVAKAPRCRSLSTQDTSQWRHQLGFAQTKLSARLVAFAPAGCSTCVLKAHTEQLQGLRRKFALDSAKTDTCVHAAQPQQRNRLARQARIPATASSALRALLDTGAVWRLRTPINIHVALTTNTARSGRQQRSPSLTDTTPWGSSPVHTFPRRCVCFETLLTFRSVLQER